MKLRSWNRYLGIVPASRSTLEDEQSLGPGVDYEHPVINEFSSSLNMHD
jgi:hypothetical protein